jgi:hypothetical protein
MLMAMESAGSTTSQLFTLKQGWWLDWRPTTSKQEVPLRRWPSKRWHGTLDSTMSTGSYGRIPSLTFRRRDPRSPFGRYVSPPVGPFTLERCMAETTSDYEWAHRSLLWELEETRRHLYNLQIRVELYTRMRRC